MSKRERVAQARNALLEAAREHVYAFPVPDEDGNIARARIVGEKIAEALAALESPPRRLRCRWRGHDWLPGPKGDPAGWWALTGKDRDWGGHTRVRSCRRCGAAEYGASE